MFAPLPQGMPIALGGHVLRPKIKIFDFNLFKIFNKLSMFPIFSLPNLDQTGIRRDVSAECPKLVYIDDIPAPVRPIVVAILRPSKLHISIKKMVS
jgi:hypothetical protein